MKIRLVRAELFHEDGLTDGYVEAKSRFSQFCEGVYKQGTATINRPRCFIVQCFPGLSYMFIFHYITRYLILQLIKYR